MADPKKLDVWHKAHRLALRSEQVALRIAGAATAAST
jgi:hypothetical protein